MPIKEKTENLMVKGIHNILFVLVIGFSLGSCGRNVVFTDSEAMPGKKWELANIPVFQVPIDDTISSNNIRFTIRTGSSYPYRNIFLFVNTTSPEGRSITDTLEYNLADESGKWLGKGFGDIHELNLPYKSAVFFPVKGSYLISVRHGMRVEDLKGVYDFGIRVEKSVK
jgi:gliding motility-associated lipoprotein GldH